MIWNVPSGMRTVYSLTFAGTPSRLSRFSVATTLKSCNTGSVDSQIGTAKYRNATGARVFRAMSQPVAANTADQMATGSSIWCNRTLLALNAMSHAYRTAASSALPGRLGWGRCDDSLLAARTSQL